MKSSLLATIAALLIGGLGACGASSGEPCQEQDDCASGLMCCKPASGLAVRGECASMCDDRRIEPTPDSAAPDSAASDSSTDASPDADVADDAASDGAAE